MKNKNFDVLRFEKKVHIGLTIFALAWLGFVFYLIWQFNNSVATTNSFQPLYEKGYVVCGVEYCTAGCFKECGIYGISVDELSEYKAGKSIVLNLHDRYGYVKMIASDKVISIEKEE